VNQGSLGRVYEDGEIIMSQGERGNCMYVIQEGTVEVFVEKDGKEVRLAERGKGEFIGEMAVFEHEVRSATVRALGRVRLLTIDKKNILRRIQEDPSLAFRLVEVLSHRVRQLSEEVATLKGHEQSK
jgi:CRP-like cAMP-binding protein